MYPAAPSEEQILAIHEALITGCCLDLDRACPPPALDRIALITLPHGTDRAEVTAGSRAEIVREIMHFASDEGPAVTDLSQLLNALARRPPAADGRLLCIVIALGHARLHDIPWPPLTPPEAVFS